MPENQNPFSYDLVRYPNLCHPQTHPDRLGCIGRLFGVVTAQPSRCSYLELGCGDGSNLLPLAIRFPESRFVGLDLSEKAIMAGQQAVTELGLSNVQLLRADLSEFPASGQRFDYVVAHGVYSWVPASVREAILAICRGRLASQGVGFVSYNCFPGCHIRRMVREIMRFHVRDHHDPAEQIRQAVAVTQFIAGSIEKPDPYRLVFKDQLEQIQRHGGGHLFHDDLAEINEPVYFHEFAAHAARHGLQFLGEADFFEMQDELFTAEAREVLGQMEGSRITREQYLDFLKCRRFRQSLVCGSEINLQLPPDSKAIFQFHLSSNAKTEPGKNTDQPEVVRFVESRGGALELGYPPAIEALKRLRQNWPGTIPFTELQEQTAAIVPAFVPPDGEHRKHLLAEAMLEAYRSGIVEFHLEPLPCASTAGEFPEVWDYARWQAGRQAVVTTLRGENLRVPDEPSRQLLRLLDGRHSLAELPSGPNDPHGANAAPVADRLQELVSLGLITKT